MTFGVAYLLLTLVLLACLAPGSGLPSLLVRLYFGLVYLILIRAILWEVWDRIVRGQEALEAMKSNSAEEQKLEELRAILASIPPTDYVLSQRS
jgi:hypothetical protein